MTDDKDESDVAVKVDNSFIDGRVTPRDYWHGDNVIVSANGIQADGFPDGWWHGDTDSEEILPTVELLESRFARVDYSGENYMRCRITMDSGYKAYGHAPKPNGMARDMPLEMVQAYHDAAAKIAECWSFHQHEVKFKKEGE